MKTLYEPSNTLEAQMLHDLLKQEGIYTRVDGAYLQGGVGELPASNLVRLVVEDEDYEHAKSVIHRWEATEVSEPKELAQKPRSSNLVVLLAGAMIGVVGSYLFFHVPLNNDGIDYNHDGILDQVWRYSASGTFLGSKVDRNLDKKIDYTETTDKNGHIVSAESDDDFDGVFETRYRLRAGNFESAEVDTDGDGLANLRSAYRNGVLSSTEYLNPYTGLPVRVEHYRLGMLTSAEVDTNTDGRLDTRFSYSPTVEIIGKQAIPAP